jgi:hypothetical protein
MPPEDHGSGLLNGLQALAEKIGISMSKLNVVLGGSAVLKPPNWQTAKATGSASVLRTSFVVSVGHSPGCSIWRPI